MPIFEFTSPEGKTYEVEGPKGSTKAQAFEILKEQLSQSQPEPINIIQGDPGYGSPRSDGIKGFMEDVGGGMTDIGMGVKQRLGMASEQDVLDKRNIDKDLKLPGQMIGQMAAMAPLAALAPASIPGAAVAGGVMGGLMPTGPDESVLKNVALGAGGGAVGQKLAGMLGANSAKQASSRATAQTLAQPHDELIQVAQKLGYKLDPTDTNPGMINKMLKRASGDAATNQRLAQQNQAVTNRIAREELGIVADLPITGELIEAVRRGAITSYEDVARSIKQFGGRFETDQAYRQTIKEAFSPYRAMRAEFGKDAKSLPIERAYRQLMRKDMDIDISMQQVRQLRKDAKALYKSDDPAKVKLAGINRGASKAIEDLIERKVEALGDPTLVQKWKDARQLLAKTHTIDDAVDAVGDVNAQAIAKAMNKGVPLSGGLESIAKIAETWPTATKLLTRGAETASMDATIGVGGMALGSPALMAYGAARPMMRAGFTGPMQRTVQPSHTAGLLERGGRAINAGGGLLGRTAGPVGMNQ